MGKLGWFMSKTYTLTSPPREGEPVGTDCGWTSLWLLWRSTRVKTLKVDHDLSLTRQLEISLLPVILAGRALKPLTSITTFIDFSQLVGALSPVNHKDLYHGWRIFSQRDIQLKGPIRQKSDQKNRVKKRRVLGRIYGMKYSWKGRKTEIEAKIE